eukprot:370464-Rhodomonas_salina.2
MDPGIRSQSRANGGNAGDKATCGSCNLINHRRRSSSVSIIGNPGMVMIMVSARCWKSMNGTHLQDAKINEGPNQR